MGEGPAKGIHIAIPRGRQDRQTGVRSGLVLGARGRQVGLGTTGSGASHSNSGSAHSGRRIVSALSVPSGHTDWSNWPVGRGTHWGTDGKRASRSCGDSSLVMVTPTSPSITRKMGSASDSGRRCNAASDGGGRSTSNGVADCRRCPAGGGMLDSAKGTDRTRGLD